MDIHQLRSWIFELYEPLEDQRQYIVFDRERGNLLIDAPVFGERPLRLIRGVGGAAVLLITTAARGADAARYRDALGLQIAAHSADAGAVPGGADVIVNDGDLLRADARVHRVGANGDGATVVLVRKAGGVLFCGDLDLGSDAARDLTTLAFSAVLSSGHAPIWGAGRDAVRLLQRELPAPKKRFGIFLQAPWDRAYRGRLQDQMTANPLVPQEETSPREAGMGPSTLIAADLVRDKIERAKRPVAATPRTTAAPAAVATPATAKGGRPRNFAEDWQAPATASPPTTRANPPRDIQPPPTASGARSAAFGPVPFGAAVPRIAAEAIAGLPYVDDRWGGIDLSPDGSEVSCAWDRSGAFEIYSVPLSGDRIFQLTEAGVRSVWPRWSPDGRTIAFLRDTEGNEQLGIWVVDRDGEHERELVGAGGDTHRDLAWSGDGRSIACVRGRGPSRAIDLIDAGSGSRRQLTDRSGAARPRSSPDGQWIVFEADGSERGTDTDLYLVPSGGGAPTVLDTRGGLAGRSQDARFSPDGRQLAFTTNVRGRREIAVATLEGSAVRALEFLTENPFEEWGARWRADGRGVVYLHEQEAAVAVHRAFTVSHAATPVSDLPGLNAWPQVGPDSETIVSTFSSARRPTDIWVRDGVGVEIRALTDSLRSAAAPVDPATFVEPRLVRYQRGDGREVTALLYVPHAEVALGEPPVGIVHLGDGRPERRGRGWDPAAQLFANRGFIVLAPSGSGSLDDALAGAAWLVAEGVAEGVQLGIYGAGYGGSLTLPRPDPRELVAALGPAGTGAVDRVEELCRVTEWFERHLTPLMLRHL